MINLEITEEISAAMRALSEAVKVQLESQGAKPDIVHLCIVTLPVKDHKIMEACPLSAISTTGRDPEVMMVASEVLADTATTTMTQDIAQMLMGGQSNVH